MIENLGFSILVAFCTALATAAVTFWGSWRQVKADLQKEYEGRFNEQKWNVYSKFMKFEGQKSLAASTANWELFRKLDSEHADLISGLLLVASDEVIRAYNDYWRFERRISSAPIKVGERPQWLDEENRKRMVIVNAMRKDLGYKSKLDSEELWAAFATLIPNEPVADKTQK